MTEFDKQSYSLILLDLQTLLLYCSCLQVWYATPYARRYGLNTLEITQQDIAGNTVCRYIKLHYYFWLFAFKFYVIAKFNVFVLISLLCNVFIIHICRMTGQFLLITFLSIWKWKDMRYMSERLHSKRKRKEIYKSRGLHKAL